MRRGARATPSVPNDAAKGGLERDGVDTEYGKTRKARMDRRDLRPSGQRHWRSAASASVEVSAHADTDDAAASARLGRHNGPHFRHHGAMILRANNGHADRRSGPVRRIGGARTDRSELHRTGDRGPNGAVALVGARAGPQHLGPAQAHARHNDGRQTGRRRRPDGRHGVEPRAMANACRRLRLHRRTAADRRTGRPARAGAIAAAMAPSSRGWRLTIGAPSTPSRRRGRIAGGPRPTVLRHAPTRYHRHVQIALGRSVPPTSRCAIASPHAAPAAFCTLPPSNSTIIAAFGGDQGARATRVALSVSGEAPQRDRGSTQASTAPTSVFWRP